MNTFEQLGRGPIGFDERYEALERRFTMRELATVPWLRAPMLATPAAIEKLLAWEARTPRPWSTPAADEVFVKLQFFGDRLSPHVLARLLTELPPAICDYALNKIMFVGVGLGTHGFCGPRLPNMPRPWLIVLGPVDRTRDNMRALMVHELSHAWLMDEPSDVTQATSFRCDVVLYEPLRDDDLADARATIQQLRLENLRDERQARELAAAWGFGEIHENKNDQADHRGSDARGDRRRPRRASGRRVRLGEGTHGAGAARARNRGAAGHRRE